MCKRLLRWKKMGIVGLMIAFAAIAWHFLPLLAVMWGFAEILRLRRRVGVLDGRVDALEAAGRTPLADVELPPNQSSRVGHAGGAL